mmetsp:Transcript_18021/g.35221  ORF Transcript_18021/g.35221 Transcript_18021/m.35221 type:complete len:244 (-) Transcript_18021:1502-2233(-)
MGDDPSGTTLALCFMLSPPPPFTSKSCSPHIFFNILCTSSSFCICCWAKAEPPRFPGWFPERRSRLVPADGRRALLEPGLPLSDVANGMSSSRLQPSSCCIVFPVQTSMPESTSARSMMPIEIRVVPSIAVTGNLKLSRGFSCAAVRDSPSPVQAGGGRVWAKVALKTSTLPSLSVFRMAHPRLWTRSVRTGTESGTLMIRPPALTIQQSRSVVGMPFSSRTQCASVSSLKTPASAAAQSRML